MGDALVGNTFTHNGYFGNPGNSDFGQITLESGQPSNCFSGNIAPDGSTPADLEQVQPTCGKRTTAASDGEPLLGQVLCDTGFGSLSDRSRLSDPEPESVMHPLPRRLPTMPNPCAGVPANAWCTGGKPV